jgi:hypothetical protein
MDPLVPQSFAELGYTKESLIGWGVDHAKLPAREYWDDFAMQTLIHPHAVAGIEPYASRLKAAPDELISLFEPDDINIVVAGGSTQADFKMFGGRYLGRGPGTPTVASRGMAAAASSPKRVRLLAW